MPWIRHTESQSGWNTGARSIAVMTGDGEFTFSVGQSVGIVCGLNYDDASAHYREIKHGFFISERSARVIESGGTYSATKTNFAYGAVFKIKRVGWVVTYFIDDVIVYTSTIASTEPVFLDCSLYADGDSVVDVTFTEISEPRLNEAISLSSLSGFGTDTDYLSRVQLSPLDIIYVPGTEIKLSAMIARGSDDSNFGSCQLSPLDISSDELVLDVNYGDIALSPLTATWRISDTYTAEIILPAITAWGVDSSADGTGAVQLSSLTTHITPYNDNSFLITLPNFTGYGFYNNTNIIIPSPILTATATAHTSGVSLTIPSPTLTSYTGAFTALEPPTPILTATATSPGYAVVTLELPEPILVANALTGEVATLTLLIPEPVLSAYSGAFASLEMPEPVLSSTGTIFGFATVTLTIPSPELVATGEIYGLASVTLKIPSPVLYAGRGNWVALEIPSPILVVVASPALTTAETTYAINLTTGAVTQLLLGGFDKLVTAHGRLYGLKNGALTRLEGDVDGTTTTIPATIRFAPQTFGTNVVKRISDVYWSTREADGITMELVADERTVWRYQTPTDTAPAFGTHKIKPGRGVTFHTAGLTLRNRDGGALDVGGVELLVSALSRKPK